MGNNLKTNFLRRRKLSFVAPISLLCAIVVCSLCPNPARAGFVDGQPPTAVKLVSGHVHNVFYVGKPVEFRVRDRVLDKGAIRYEVRNYVGDLVDSGVVSGETVTLKVSLAGWYKLYLFGSVDQGGDFGSSVGGTTFCIFRHDANFPDFPPLLVQDKTLTRVDKTIDFAWGTNSPAPGLPATGYRVEWKGKLQAVSNESYDFSTGSNDGALVKVNGVTVVDSSKGLNNGSVTLKAGQKYDVEMTYAQGQYSSNAPQLRWHTSTIRQVVIPTAHLFSVGNTTEVGDGLTGNYFDNNRLLSADGGQNTALQSVLASGPERYAADVSSDKTTADSIQRLDHDIAIAKELYVGRDAARPRPLMIAFSNGTKNLDAVRQIVTHFQHDVQYWEPRNEPNFGASGHDFAINEMKPFYDVVKSVNRNLKVLGPGTVDIRPATLRWTDDFFKAGGKDSIDAFSFHAYNAINGDAELARQSFAGLNALLKKYGLQNIEKWQTEQGYFTAVYGAYEPRLNGRWTMLQKMIFEQQGIPKEHDHLWYDKSHGFWDVPAWLENDDGSLNPAAPLMRVWSEELFGTSFQRALDFGTPGNNLLLGSVFKGNDKSVVALQSTGATDLNVELKLSTNDPVKIVTAWGESSTRTPIKNRLALTVPEVPVYVELATGQTVDVAPTDWGADLALKSTVTASGDSTHPAGAQIENSPAKLVNGELETWYLNQTNADYAWTSNQKEISAAHPLTVEIDLPSVQTFNRVLVYAAVPWQAGGSLLDYELQYDKNGVWTPLDHIVEPAKTFKVWTPFARSKVDQFYSDRDVFSHSFAPVTSGKIRLVINAVTVGGGALQMVQDAGGQTGYHQATIREIEVYNEPNAAPNGNALHAIPTASTALTNTNSSTSWTSGFINALDALRQGIQKLLSHLF